MARRDAAAAVAALNRRRWCDSWQTVALRDATAFAFACRCSKITINDKIRVGFDRPSPKSSLKLLSGGFGEGKERPALLTNDRLLRPLRKV